MTFYICITILTVLIMVTMILHISHYSGFTKTQKSWFITTFLAIIVCSIAEFLVHSGYYEPKYAIVLTIITAFQFSLAPILGILFAGALGVKHQEIVGIICYSINLIIEAVSAPFGLIFYFNEEGYFRGDYFIIYEAIYFLSLVYLVIILVVVGKRYNHRDARTIIMILVIFIAGIIPMTLYKINVTYLAIAIGSSLCYIYYNDLVQQDIQAEFALNQKKISKMQKQIISGLSNLIENRDTETGEHISRTNSYVKLIAKSARKDGVYTDIIDDHFIMLLQTLAPMHDIGKILVSDTILKKPGKLTKEEREEMKKHASEGGSVVKKVLSGIADKEYLSFASDIAIYHHEWWDGTGYPKKLKGESIPLSARIMAVADVFDALVSKRCYKESIPIEEAFDIIKRESGTHFDPKLVDVFLNHKDEFINILNKN